MKSVSVRTQPGDLFARVALALAATHSAASAARYARRWRDTPDVATFLERAAAGSLTTVTGAPLVAPGVSEFINLVAARTIIGRIPRLRRVPFYHGAAMATGGSSYGWVTNGAPIPVGRPSFTTASLPVATAGGLIVLTEELVKSASPAAEALVRAQLVDGLARFLDREFVDPANAPVPDLSPGSVTYDAPSSAATADPAADLAELIGAIAADLGTLDGVVLLMSDILAVRLAMRSGAGGALFPGIGAAGGTLYGLPVLTSSALGDTVVAMHSASILVADESGIELDSARGATLVMDDAPGEGAEPQAHVSLWQSNAVALRLTRSINWSRARPGAVHVLTGAAY